GALEGDFSGTTNYYRDAVASFVSPTTVIHIGRDYSSSRSVIQRVCQRHDCGVLIYDLCAVGVVTAR
ncbi:hypothetical protein NX04_07640, partial [Xanthomonas vasicola]